MSYNTCIECKKESPYKCPTCYKPYCSVTCCKKHKLNQCSAPPAAIVKSNEEPNATHNLFPTEDTMPLEKLELLEQSTEVKKCLANPHVRKILETLDNSPHPDELMQEYMQEPIFTEFVDACLQVVQADDSK